MLIDPLGWTRDIREGMHRVYDALVGQLTIEENIRSRTLTVVSSGTPSATFTVTHNLGKVPQRWIANPQASCNIWEINRSTWTESTMQLRCSGTSVTIVLTVL